MNRNKMRRIVTLILWVILVVLTLVKGWWYPLAALFLLHLAEVFLVGIKTGKENATGPVKAVILTLIFGVTWWGPLRRQKDEL